MKRVIRIDAEGFFLEDVLIEDDQELPEGCVEDLPAEGFYLPRRVDGNWVEGKTEAEIAALQTVQEPSEVEVLRQEVADLKERLAVLEGNTVA
jgi:hypothetical protein